MRVGREQPVADHGHAKAELARSLDDRAQRPVDQRLAARQADHRVALGAQHAERLAQHVRIERRPCCGSDSE